MEKIADAITTYCLDRGIVDSADESWFHYGLEKRLISILYMIPLSVLAALLSNVPAAISYLVGYRLLRESISGYHAETPAKCLCLSVLTELLFFCGLYPHLCFVVLVISNVLSVGAIFFLAPYNHPNMHLSEEEILALRPRGRILAITMALIALLCWFSGLRSISYGLTIAVTMYAFLLCMAYIIDWRKTA